MNTRLLMLGIAAATVAAGCGNPPRQTSNMPAPAQPVAEAALPVAPTAGSDAGSADALARKAEAYSREMQAMLSRRSPAPMPQPVPSVVEWLDPSEFRLSNLPTPEPSASGIRDDGAAVRPIVQTGAVEANNAGPADAGRSNASADCGALKTRLDGGANTAVALASTPRLAAPKSTPVLTDALAEKFARRVRDYPRDVSAQLEYQLLQFLLDQPTPQLATVSGLPAEDREMITAVIDALVNFRNALRADANMLLSKKIKPILELAERLRSQADLTIPTIALCTRVNGFGAYDPIDPLRFAAGRDHRAIVYCEVSNFTSNLNDKQLWETRLSWDMTLYTEQGMSVWADKTEPITDVARNRRHDFFVRKMITLPSTLTIGRYLLKVSIVDTQSNRVAEATVPIVIAAQ